MNVGDNDIQRLVIEAIRIRELFNPEEFEMLNRAEPEEEIKFEPRSLPADAKKITDLATFYGVLGQGSESMPAELDQVMEYLLKREIDIVKYDFYWSPSDKLKTRIIIPYLYNHEIIGYTARTIKPDQKPKYYSDHPADFVFNLDTQQRDWKFVIVCEGAFDAMSVDGVSVSGAEITDQQAELIERLNRETILVPDWDDAGRRTINVAMDRGWTVSFPTWRETCKDINEATIKYGKLFVIKDILENRESNKLKIKLKQKATFK
jgi:5S rRNA maturation endonuclease (ribonuclease M5)